MLKVSVAVIIGILLPLAAIAASGQGFSFRAGVGYDFLSQQYFVDSITVSGADSVLTRWSLTSEYLDDLKGRFEVAFRQTGKSQLELRSLYEQTPEILKLKLNTDWRHETILGELRWRSQVDWRGQYSGNRSDLGSYLSGSTVARVKKPVGFNTALWGQVQGDITNFYDSAAYGYDHFRVGGKAGVEQTLGLLSMASLNGFYLARQVADSQTLSYGSFGLEGSFSGSTSRLDIDLLSRWESKDHNRPDGENDYSRFEADLMSRLALGERFFSRQRMGAEITSYDPADLLNNGYQRYDLTLLGGVQLGGLELAFGPYFELLRATTDDTSSAEDYFEAAGMIDIGYFSAQGMFVSLESRLGHRQLEYINEYQANFIFYQLLLITDWTILKRVNLNLLLSTEWEWHDETSYDNHILLLSTGLTYAF